MSRNTIELTDALYNYLLDVSLREPEALRRQRDRTAGIPEADLQISPEQGQFLYFLAKSIGARHIIEIGTFMGYSAAWMAMALPEGGRLIACDVNREWTDRARALWREAGVDDRIDLRLAPAIGTLESLLAGGGEGQTDFVFIDALKTEYQAYFELALRLLRPGGLVAIDNTLWSGRMLDQADQDPLTNAIREFNRRLASDERVDLSMLPISDGLTLARKRASPGDM